jgi:serine-type D-Ala-D-Ala carboxypeptidase/endopeptidase (penicillin-binding protein 4)
MFYLDHVKIRRSEYFLNSGSGFSHANVITPRAMIQLLTHLKSEPTVSSAFLSSLPVAGTDGTLARRMNKTAAQGRVRAKTGFLRSIPAKKLDGAVSLAGYATQPGGRTFTFTFFYNGVASPDLVRSTFDNLSIVLAGGKPVDPPPPKVKKPAKKKAAAKKKARTRKKSRSKSKSKS